MNLNPDNLRAEFFAGHDPAQLKAWQSSIVAIAGAGGLGSNIAIALTRAGIGKIIIADFDTIIPSNLNRQQYFIEQIGQPKVQALRDNLAKISPFTQVCTHQTRINPDNLANIFGEAEIMLEAFDSNEQKAMLLYAWSELYPSRPYIGGSGLAGIGNNQSITTNQYGNIYIIGDGYSELCPPVSPVSARVAVVAAMQANLCLELLCKEKQ